MGKRGPAPKPTELLQSWRKNVREKAGVPQAELGKPTCPRWLKEGRARNEWKRIAKLTDDMGVLALTDGNALARYCVLWDRWLSAEEYIAEQGASSRYADDRTKAAVRQASDLSKQLTRLEAEFGLTPSARSRVVVEQREKPQGNNRGGPGKAKYFPNAS